MDESTRGTWSGRWSILVGVCLALIAAGSFVAFSLVAREAGTSGLAGRAQARRVATTSPVITLGEPPRQEARPGRAGGEGPVTTTVLGTRFSSGSTPKTPEQPDRPDKPRKPDKPKPTDPVPTLPTPGRKPHKVGGHGKPASPSTGPHPNGVANGHKKAKGKGHNKHPHDH